VAEMGKDSFLELGSVMVETTQNKGHDPEFWAEQITKKICDISADAAPHIRQQAEAFQNYIYTIVFCGSHVWNRYGNSKRMHDLQ
jgi:hypothetical protein